MRGKFNSSQISGKTKSKVDKVREAWTISGLISRSESFKTLVALKEGIV